MTGAAGFAGKWLCRHLVGQGHDVSGWVRRECQDGVAGVRYRVQDVTDGAGCAMAMDEDRPDIVFHLAAVTNVGACEQRPDVALAVNVEGTRNVFSCLPQSARGVLISTCHVYANAGGELLTERHAVKPLGVYASSKHEAEKVALEVARDVVVIRAFHHTGPGQSEAYVLSDWAAQVRAGKAEVAVGDTSLRRDFSDVRDIVAGYTLLGAEGNSREIYNLASGQSHTLQTYFDWISEGSSCVAVPDAARLRSNDNRVMVGDPSKAERLGWRRSHSLRRTLAQMAG